MDIKNVPEHSFIDKWSWMMDYCLKNRWPPSNSYFWRKAEDAYFKKSTKLC